jgi:hypothetical protein
MVKAANLYLVSIGKLKTHCLTGTFMGKTLSTSRAAVSAIRRPVHDGQKPRRLQLNAILSSFP